MNELQYRLNSYVYKIKNNDNFNVDEYVTSCYEKFIEKTSDSKDNPFYRAILLSMVYKSSFNNKKALLDCCEYLFQGLSYPKEQKQFLCGEWKSFITPFHQYKQSVVGVVSCVNAFIDNGDKKEAILIYEKARELGLSYNRYIERRLY